jgi:Rrf2 family protein
MRMEGRCARVFITRRTDYAVRIMLEVARSGGRAPSRRLGELAEVSYPFARSIVTDLSGAGLVDAKRGPGGGVALSRPASEISLLQIVEAMEGPVVLNVCISDPGYCHRAPECPAHGVWAEASTMLATYMSKQDLESLVTCTAPGSKVR